MEMKIATRRCRDQTGRDRQFHYFLTVDLEETPNFICENYGIRITEEGGDERTLPAVTTSAARIDELMALLVDNTVGPAGLDDVVGEWL